MAVNITINALTNAAIYIDGVGYIGKASKINTPHPKQKMSDYKGLGMIGAVELWSGVDKLESKISWSSFDPGAIGVAVDFTTVRRIQARGNLQNFTSAGLAAELPVVYLLTGVFKDPGGPEHEHQTMVKDEVSIAVYHSELSVAGVQIFAYDAFANTYIVNGVDKLATMRANLGMS